MERFDLIDSFGDAVLAGNGAMFVGAGLSLDAGMPGWKGLLLGLKDKCEIPSMEDLPLLAEYIANDAKNAGRAALEEHILDEIASKGCVPTDGHQLVGRIPIQEIWTTNYDRLLESALGQDVTVAITDSDIQSIGSARRTLVKMHGSISNGPPPVWAARPVITRSDYEQYEQKHPRTWALLRAAYLSRTILFLGFSFTDPNVEVLLRLARQLGTAVTDRHMTVMKRPTDTDELRLHELRVRDLESSGVKVCEINEYSELGTVLQELVRRTRPPQVFISGSAGKNAGGGENPDETILPWCEPIAQQITDDANWLLTSLGGPAGWQITRDVARARRAEDTYDPHLLTFHFRSKQEPPPRMDERIGTAVYTSLEREQLVGGLLDDCRALVAVCGGRRTAEEIRWARERGVGVIPVAASGGAARAYWEEVGTQPPDLGGRPTDLDVWRRLGDGNYVVAARAAYTLLKQAMYQR